MKIILLRHGRTQGNLLRRYIGGRTDEPLIPQERERLRALHAPKADRVFASPLLRCMETAAILYSDQEITKVPDLRECDFGRFENHNYQELKDEPAYQAWLDSNGTLPFPEGESRRDFTSRCVRAFEDAVQDLPEGDHAFVVHGGTIMAIMERFARPQGDYYDFQVSNGAGYILNMEDGSYRICKLDI